MFDEIFTDKIFEQLCTIEAIDHYAAPQVSDLSALSELNITELTVTPEMIKIMQALGCDEKYIEGRASDFEIFSEWERMLPMCIGTGANRLYREELELVGMQVPKEDITLDDSCERWKNAVRLLAKKENNLNRCGISCLLKRYDINEYVTKYITNIKRNDLTEIKISDISENILNDIRCYKNSTYQVFLDISCLPYERPDPYHAQLALFKIINGEKYNRSEEFSLLSQVLIDLLLEAASDLKMFLHIYAGKTTESVLELLEYIGKVIKKRIEIQSVRVGVSTDIGTSELFKISEKRINDIKIFPELVLSVGDLGRRMDDILTNIANEYPIAALRFGGIANRSNMFYAADILFLRYFSRCLSNICESEIIAMKIANEFFGV